MTDKHSESWKTCTLFMKNSVKLDNLPSRQNDFRVLLQAFSMHKDVWKLQNKTNKRTVTFFPFKLLVNKGSRMISRSRLCWLGFIPSDLTPTKCFTWIDGLQTIDQTPCSHYLKSMLEAPSTSLCARWGMSPTRIVQSQKCPSFLRAHSCCISWLL